MKSWYLALQWSVSGLHAGGLPDIRRMTSGRMSSGFVGCIRDVYLHNRGPINFQSDVIDGINVTPC